jgi:hypothetical protein
MLWLLAGAASAVRGCHACPSPSVHHANLATYHGWQGSVLTTASPPPPFQLLPYRPAIFEPIPVQAPIDPIVTLYCRPHAPTMKRSLLNALMPLPRLYVLLDLRVPHACWLHDLGPPPPRPCVTGPAPSWPLTSQRTPSNTSWLQMHSSGSRGCWLGGEGVLPLGLRF